MEEETIYLSHDNASHLLVKEKGQIISDLSFLTRVVVSIGGQSFDSDILDNSHIWWTDKVTLDDGSLVDCIKFWLGDQIIEPAKYLGCRLVLFDVTNLLGVVFTDKLTVVVK